MIYVYIIVCVYINTIDTQIHSTYKHTHIYSTRIQYILTRTDIVHINTYIYTDVVHINTPI